MDGDLAGEPNGITVADLVLLSMGAASALTLAAFWPAEPLHIDGFSGQKCPPWIEPFQKAHEFLLLSGLAIAPAILARLARYDRLTRVGEWSVLLLAVAAAVQLLPPPHRPGQWLVFYWTGIPRCNEDQSRWSIALLGLLTLGISLGSLIKARSLRGSRWNSWRTVLRMVAVSAALWGHLRIFAELWFSPNREPYLFPWGSLQWASIQARRCLGVLIGTLVFGVPAAIGLVNLFRQPRRSRPWTARMGLPMTAAAGACWLFVHEAQSHVDRNHFDLNFEVFRSALVDIEHFLPAALICGLVAWRYSRTLALANELSPRASGQSLLVRPARVR